MRVAPPRMAFRIEQMRQARWGNTEPEWRLLHELADPDRAAVDVGGNHGLYAGQLARLCPQVHCFEPQPALVAELQRKLPRNVTIHNMALSDTTGIATLRVPPGDDGRASLHPANAVRGDTLLVPLRRLDDVVREPVGFMKIDVEGHEMAVLRGAEEIIRRDRPALLVEAEAMHEPSQPFELFRHLFDRGYAGWFLWQGERLSVEAFSPETHQREDRMGGYAHNFMFCANADWPLR
ncbi:FkbM family methyltransferase [Sabulicella glaciei]|uniref:FkbM family methyltransferase n=1 Tax=Sabulicella glaciei TaxID=2984948 RepID=A0ABT3NYS3_9PROT|nr:FkbM family methyltransferase [Roseococcus sp. MDT2-1-1]MCW8087317.1 FkbM family methyltransferase [Roseococcus sp. MDT2-1-1]